MKIVQDLIVLTSPPASGKTYWIETFARGIGPSSLMVISPLRALADECRDKWKDEIKVVTPEEWLLTQEYRDIIVFDEFHLNYYWGDSFRPVLWEVFYALSSRARLCVLLTATLSPEMEDEIRLMGLHFNQIVFCDYGNRKLKFHPARYYKAPTKTWMRDFIDLGPRGNGVNLIFCAFRNEVFEWGERLRKSGYIVWTCVGGESREMRIRMASESVPHFIVATTVLGHGVNLPAISCVYFLYPLKNIDFWIQMVARGGRKGEDYEVFALENPHGIKWKLSSNFLAILGLSLRMRLHSLKREFDQWFLKESS
ncbi:MAG TPA: helicase-related protein [Bacteriovoracaceae bacterium]|nr:helicase-related protein [Bacteriovoracaceae bacterium]